MLLVPLILIYLYALVGAVGIGILLTLVRCWNYGTFKAVAAAIKKCEINSSCRTAPIALLLAPKILIGY